MPIPVFVAFVGDLTGLKGAMAEAGAEMELLSKRGAGTMAKLSALSTAAVVGVGVAAVGVAVESVKMGAAFQQSMTLLATQAGVPQDQIKKLGQAVLDLAPKTGTGPEALALSLYHIESTLPKTMSATDRYNTSVQEMTIAAEGAKVGHADLESVTNALTAALVSGIPGVQNMSGAMGALNATVGAGDMKMQDLADAFGGGMVAVVKGFGLSLNDVGAALATFGDNNIRGADAGTALRMAVQALAKPVVGGAAAFKQMNLSQKQLGDDMATGGLNKAIIDLHDHLVAAGDAGANMGEVLTAAFGKKAGTGINVLEGQFARFETKLVAVKDGANTFQSAWALTTQNLAFQFDRLKAAVEALGIKIGTFLIPYVEKASKALADGIKWLLGHKEAMTALAVGIGTVLVAAFIVATAAAVAFTASLLVNPIFLIVAGVAALGAGLYEAYKHSEQFRQVIQDIGTWGKKVFADLRTDVREIVEGFKGGGQSGSFFGKVGAEVERLWNEIKAFVADAPAALEHAFDNVMHAGDNVGHAFDNVKQALGDALNAVEHAGDNVWHAFQNVEHAAENVMHAFQNVEHAAMNVWHAFQNAKQAVGDVFTYIGARVTDFEAFWNAHGTNIITIFKFVWNALTLPVRTAWEIINSLVQVGFDVLTPLFSNGTHVISTIVSTAFSFISGLVSAWWPTFIQVFRTGWTVLTAAAKVAWDIVYAVVETAWRLIADVVKNGLRIVEDLVGLFADFLTGHWSKLWGDVKKLVTDNLALVTSVLSDFARGAIKLLETAGVDMIKGFINGIKSMGKLAEDAAKSVVHGAVSGVKSFLGIKSPSTVFHEIGQNLMQGLANGVGSQASIATTAMSVAMKKLTGAATGSAAFTLNASANAALVGTGALSASASRSGGEQPIVVNLTGNTFVGGSQADAKKMATWIHDELRAQVQRGKRLNGVSQFA
jgi:TP901 family phage tail tape measure protein